MRVFPDLQGGVFAPLVTPELIERTKRLRDSAYGMGPVLRGQPWTEVTPMCLCPKCGAGHIRFIPDIEERVL